MAALVMALPIALVATVGALARADTVVLPGPIRTTCRSRRGRRAPRRSATGRRSSRRRAGRTRTAERRIPARACRSTARSVLRAARGAGSSWGRWPGSAPTRRRCRPTRCRCPCAEGATTRCRTGTLRRAPEGAEAFLNRPAGTSTLRSTRRATPIRPARGRRRPTRRSIRGSPWQSSRSGARTGGSGGVRATVSGSSCGSSRRSTPPPFTARR